ncbi:HupE/UreJ family protein [Ideonella sp. DXS29W]|uniref:HupE/UreJ family protein n=1 Tax=Ideonella lacteola TaxID=2984193 RepID=A0ABU9BL31_9BURK
MSMARRVWLALCLGVWSVWAGAHPMPESQVWIDTTPGGLRLTLQLPLNRLEYGFGQPLADEPDQALPRHGDALARYLAQHVIARSGTQVWQAARPSLQVLGHDASAELHAVIELQAPPGADPRTPTLDIDAVIHEVRTHRVQVFLRNDWSGGRAGEAPLLLGELTHGHASLPLNLAPATAGASALRLFKAGAWHIAEGTDHLLFLLLLVIVAPASAASGRWLAPRQDGRAVRQLAWVATAFTIGHSVTLALGSTGVLALPSQPVEIAVAVTIAVAAWHAWRPLVVDGELVMALGFGLIHGLAFSASLSGAGLTAWQHAQALLAFNLGIEAMQLALLLVVAPVLLAWCRKSATGYDRLRQIVAAGGGLMAIWWVIERAGVAVAAGA